MEEPPPLPESAERVPANLKTSADAVSPEPERGPPSRAGGGTPRIGRMAVLKSATTKPGGIGDAPERLFVVGRPAGLARLGDRFRRGADAGGLRAGAPRPRR